MTELSNIKVGGPPDEEHVAVRSQRMRDDLAAGGTEPYDNPDGLDDVADWLAKMAPTRPDWEWRVRSAAHLLREQQKDGRLEP